MYTWHIGPLTVDVFHGTGSHEFFWSFSYNDQHGFQFGPVSDQEAQKTLGLAVHAAEHAVVLLKLALEAAARHPSQPPPPED